MKIKIEKDDFVNLIGRAQNIVEKRNTMPVLVNVLLDASSDHLRVFATDLEVSLTDQVKCEVLQSGKVAVNARSLFDILKELPNGMVQLEKKENNWLKISQNKAVFNIVGISPDEYPVFPSFTTKDFISTETAMLREMIEKTIYSVSTDETRYHLNGVFFEKHQDQGVNVYRMVATDGHRLSLIDRKSQNSSGIKSPTQSVIIPRKGLHELRKLLDNAGDIV